MLVTLNRFEQGVMEMFLAGDDDHLRVLAEQFRVASVIRRELTGVGFFLDFSVPPGAPRLARQEPFHLADVFAEMAGTQHGAGFVLHGRNGAIESLEGACSDNEWPSNPDTFRFSYLGGSSRNLDRLRLELSEMGS